MLRRVRHGRHSTKNCSPQRHCCQSSRGRKSNGASACPSQRRIFMGAAGLAHGSTCDTEIWPPLANEVSSPAPLRRSTTVTSCPAARRYQAAVVPITPAPRTRTFMRDTRSSVRLDRDAGAEQIAVAVNVIGSADRRPVLGIFERGHRKSRLLTAICVLPLRHQQRRGGVRRVLERIVE